MRPNVFDETDPPDILSDPKHPLSVLIPVGGLTGLRDTVAGTVFRGDRNGNGKRNTRRTL
jgi:hypothetical protein